MKRWRCATGLRVFTTPPWRAGGSQTRAGFVVQAAMVGESLMTLAGGSEPVTSTKQLRHRLDRVYDACFIVIAYLVGARLSEIAGLTAGCIESHPSADGQERFAYLVGRIWKTSPDGQGRPHRWVAPAPVVRAVEVMERLSEPLRRHHRPKRVVPDHGQHGPDRAGAARGVTPRRRRGATLNELFAPFIGLPTGAAGPGGSTPTRVARPSLASSASATERAWRP